MSTIEELLKHDLRLPSPPAIAVRIVDLVKRDDFSFKQLAQVSVQKVHGVRGVANGLEVICQRARNRELS